MPVRSTKVRRAAPSVVRRTAGALLRRLAVAVARRDGVARRARLALERIEESFFLVGNDWRLLDVNRAAEQLCRAGRRDLVGRVLWDVLPGIAGTRSEEECRLAVAEGRNGQFEDFFVPLGVWLCFHAYPAPCNLTLVVTDITARKSAEAALEAERSRLWAVLENMPSGVLLAEAPSGRIVAWNRHVEEILRRPYVAPRDIAEYSGRVSRPDGTPCAPEEVPLARALLEGTTVRDEELGIVRGDGSRRTVAVSAAPIRDAAGAIVAGVAIVDDITERKRVEVEREMCLRREEEGRLQAEAASRFKDEFLATVSHELRTPLSSIYGWARLFESGALRGRDGEDAISSISRSARSLARIVDDLLDLSGGRLGTRGLALERLELGPIILETVEEMRPEAEARGVTFEPEVDDSLCPILGDAHRVKQILRNLLANAIKFTPRGGRVSVRRVCFDQAVEVIVADTGRGIRSEFLPHVFEPFEQADGNGAWRRTNGGLGLGLALVKQWVELHGGTIEARSDGEDAGATFRVVFPLAPAEERGSDGATGTVVPGPSTRSPSTPSR